MKKYFAIFIAIMFCIAMMIPATASAGFFDDPCFDKDGNRISNFGHCNDYNGGTKLVPMYENEAGNEAEAADESSDEGDSEGDITEDSDCNDGGKGGHGGGGKGGHGGGGKGGHGGGGKGGHGGGGRGR